MMLGVAVVIMMTVVRMTRVPTIHTIATESQGEPRDFELWFVTYGTVPSYNAPLSRILFEAKETQWFDHLRGCTQHHLPSSFMLEFGDIMRQSKGGGYWIWRFPLLEMTLRQMRDGDILVFADAGCHLNKVLLCVLLIDDCIVTPALYYTAASP